MFVLVPVLFGILSIEKMSFVRFDKAVFPGIAIRTVATGFDASRVEKEITLPIERSIAQVGGIQKMTSVSEDGLSVIQLRLETNSDLKLKALELREKIDGILSIFPMEIHKPQVYRYDPTTSPVMVVTFSSDHLTQDELRELVEKSFQQRIDSVEGVSQVISAGGSIREIMIACDSEELETYSLSLRDIVNQFQDRNRNESLGKIKVSNESFPLVLRNKFRQMIEITDMPIKVDSQGRVVSLNNLAKVSYSPRDDHIGSRLNAKDTVSIFVYKNESADIIRVSEEIQNLINHYRIDGVNVQINQDESILLRETIIAIFKLWAFIFIFLFIFTLSRKKSFSSFLIFSLTVMCSFLSLVVLYRLLKQNVVLSGIYGSFLACLVWYFFRLREFKNRELTAPEVSKYRMNVLYQVFIFSILFVKLLNPSIFVFYSVFTIHFCICIILFDLVFPILYVNFSQKIKISSDWKSDYISNLFGLLKDSLETRTKEKIQQLQDRILSHRLIPPASIIFITCVSLYSIIHMESLDYIPSDEQEIVAYLEFPSGTSFVYTNEIALKIEKQMTKASGVKQIISKIDPGHCLFLIKLEGGILPDRDFLNSLRKGIGSTEDGFLFFASDLNSSFFSEITFDVIGHDQEELERITRNLVEKLKNKEGVSDAVLRYKEARIELQFIPNHESMQTSRISIPMFGDELKLALLGGVATKFIDNDKEIDIRVRNSQQFRDTSHKFQNLRLKNGSDDFVPISEIVKTSEKKVPLKYFHKNRDRVLSFTAKLDGNSRLLREDIIQLVKSEAMPEDYHIEIESDVEDFSSLNNRLFYLIYPVLFCLFVYFYFGSRLGLVHFILLSSFSYLFTIFLLQFYFSGPLYLPFQIGLTFCFPLGVFFLNMNQKVLVYFSICFGLTLLPLILFLDPALISFYHIWLCITIYMILLAFCHSIAKGVQVMDKKLLHLK